MQLWQYCMNKIYVHFINLPIYLYNVLLHYLKERTRSRFFNSLCL